MKYFCRSVVLVLVISGLGISQERQLDLKNRRITIKMETQPLGNVFKYLMENYDIPIGFEESTLDRGRPDFKFYANLPGQPQNKSQSDDGVGFTWTYKGRIFKAKKYPITLDAENERLEEVFDKIVGQMENYKWEINDGVVNIFPAKGRDERFKKLMGMNVQRFTLEKGKTVEDITTNLLSLPELVRFLEGNKLIFLGVRNGTSTDVLKAQYGRPIDVRIVFSNMTFRDLLNRITKIKRGGWVLRWLWNSSTARWENIDIDI
jgi:hypothetical protein